MKSQYLKEAFKALDILNEEDFNLSSSDAFDKIDSFYNEDDIDVTTVIDPEANDESELKDSYIGNVILECAVCHSLIYKNPDEVTIDEENDSVANISDECPYCFGHNGYKVIGQVEPYNQEDAEELDKEPEPTTSEEDDDVTATEENDGDTTATEENDEDDFIIDESFDSVKVVADGKELSMNTDEEGGIHIDETPILDSTDDEELLGGDAMIAPVEDETKDTIEDNSEEEFPEEDTDSAEDELVPDENGDVEVDMNDFDDEGFNELGESYLKTVYENVSAFKVTNAAMNENLIKIDGDITFTSGNKKPTSFIFESKDITKDGRIRFTGENTQITRGKKTFVLTAQLNKDKLVCESLNYNYKAKNADGKSVRLYKTIRL